MHKVVVERPRRNPGVGKNRRRANLPEELLPKFEGIKRPHRCRKAFTDLLGPLRRWLHAQVGRPWNDVYSEACAVIKADSVIRAHVKTHLLEFVERHAFMHKEKVCVLDIGYHGRGIVPVEARRHRWTLFFVHPETYLLCEIPRRPRRQRRNLEAERRTLTIRWLNETKLLRLLNGCWYECCMAEFPKLYRKGESPWRFDAAEKKPICRAMARELYGRKVYCVSKRQLSRRELRKFRLVNENQVERSLQPIVDGSVGDCAPLLANCRTNGRLPTETNP